MKILLTIVASAPDAIKSSETLYDGIELIHIEDGENEKELMQRATKIAKGKYCVLCNRKFMLADVQPLLNILDKNTSDMVYFTGGSAIKTAIVKGAAKNCEDYFSCFILSILGCKTLLKTIYAPFSFGKNPIKLNDESVAGIVKSAEEFSNSKAKLTKEVYSYALNSMCGLLVPFYLNAILAVREGDWELKKLSDLDYKLKAGIVLYLALEKNFTAANLHKLREKDFKISRLTAWKFKKALEKY